MEQGPTFAPQAIGGTNQSLIQSNFGSKGDFDAVFLMDVGEERILNIGSVLTIQIKFLQWHPGKAFFDAGSNQSLIQSNFGSKGNFELVAFDNANKLFHLSNNNDDPNPDNTWNVIGLGD